MPEVRSLTKTTDRLRMHYLEAGPEDGIPVLLVQGNLSTGLFFEPLMAEAPDGFRLIAPDMRGFGDTERLPIDATRGLRDWADDCHSLVRALGLLEPLHLAGWSTGGAAIAFYALDRAVASLTFIDPVSPYGFGGVKRDGTPCFADYAGSGGGTGNPEFAQRITDNDMSSDSPLSPRNVMNSSYWNTSHREPAAREDALVAAINQSVIGDDGYPGDLVRSPNWPGVAPGTRGILNALSPKYCNWSAVVDLDPKPPILWTHGSDDIVVADGSPWEMGKLGELGVVPGWPGAEVFPPQPQVSQIRDVLTTYQERGGRVEMETYQGSGHFPVADAYDRWRRRFFDFIASVP